MKNKLIGFSIISFIALSTAHAEDSSSVLSVSGTVTAISTACQIELNKSSINLTADTSSIIKQGAKSTSIAPFSMSVWGVDNNSTCAQKLWKGKIAVRFVGTHDNADGTTFANTSTGEEAAGGVGIGIFETNNTPVDINQPYLLGDKSTVAVKYLGLQLVELNGQTATKGKVTGDMTFQIERL
ncbi:type 1 fimbrial protein [Cronobacter dublinensis]|uniref:Type 1 fimbrial protein n=1 Tax=Cronobacter dublinensis TaxID=413497 RepID=A0A9Q4T5T1_9ENTR|nr:fimbrial protein [Cronobacter dublinensis]ELY2857081.1 type 1 fimbrial protein [Cronobacter dublinensis]NCH88894.1 type 1 fimbrial protein [Cronobacter dublinensis]NHV91050.1 type 1 fimbrial protein [Cronobacter dublinensis]